MYACEMDKRINQNMLARQTVKEKYCKKNVKRRKNCLKQIYELQSQKYFLTPCINAVTMS